MKLKNDDRTTKCTNNRIYRKTQMKLQRNILTGYHNNGEKKEV
jgi:hypothetical protein